MSTNYNVNLQTKNSKLQSILNTINTLPDAGEAGENLDEEITTQTTLLSEQDTKISELSNILASKSKVSLPSLINPGTAENLQEGYELIDSNGNVITGTHVCESVGTGGLEWIPCSSLPTAYAVMPEPGALQYYIELPSEDCLVLFYNNNTIGRCRLGCFDVRRRKSTQDISAIYATYGAEGPSVIEDSGSFYLQLTSSRPSGYYAIMPTLGI